jgi:membrane protein DedA with SNARE-associated domain
MEQRQFFIRNIVRGILWLVAIVIGYIIFKRFVNIDYVRWLEPFFDQKFLIFGIYAISEVFVGIIPPEFFIIWALKFGSLQSYLTIVFLLSILSYFAGIGGYFIGKYFSYTRLYKYVWKRYLQKISSNLHNFGAVLIIVAALTPIPFSGVAMLMGSINYRFSKYFFYSLARFLKFGIGAWVLWETQLLT